MKNNRENHIIIGPVRLAYAHVWEPVSFNGEAPRYSCVLLIPKEDTETVEKICRASESALIRDIDRFGGTLPPKDGLRMPLRDGDAEDAKEAFRGCWYLKAKSRIAPGIVDRDLRRITAPDEIYSGCTVRASLTFFAYSNISGNGVTCALGNLQKVADGEELGRYMSAADEFADADL